MEHENGIESVVYSGKTIDQSSGTIQSIATILAEAVDAKVAADLQRAKKQRSSVRWVEIRGHGASFYFGDSDHTNKDTQAANDPYFRYGNYIMLENTYLRAVADADITGVVIEVGYGEKDTTS